ncbi:MAG: ABC transporter permease, partial [Bacteroidetes bacterium]|nr:ABC transporter permease [Bacteroidota bacterium]
MRKSWLIALREWNERVKSRSFIGMAVLGPLILLFLLFVLFQIGGKKTVKWKILVADKGQILSNKMAPRENADLSYFFINDYIEIEEFAKGNKYQEYDALLEVNEKVLSNKVGFVFYREVPSSGLEKKVQYQLERRLEEVLVNKYNTIDLADFRKIKQPLTLSFRNVYDPQDKAADKRGWVGVIFGGLIFVFIALYGMTVLRSTTREKSSRIAEVLLGAVQPIHLMIGKIWGIGMAAFFQFAIWSIILLSGLSWMRETYFPDYLQANIENVNSDQQLDEDAVYQYNEFVDLVYDRIQFGPVLGAFVVFFVLGFLFYSSLFSACGASLGSESDGQQFVIPLLLLLCFGAYSGYYVL